MGQTCTMPVINRDDEFDDDPNRSLIKSELARSKAEVLMDIPGADVVIVDVNGEEANVASGGFRLVQLAPPSKLVVFFVGDSFDDLSDTGFYYPLLAETPVCLSHRKASGQNPGKHILTMIAGEGDVFGITLPDPLPEGVDVDTLVELLSQRCILQIAQEPDFADKVVQGVLAGGKKLIGGIEWATEKMSVGIAKGGDAARKKVGKAEKDMEIGPATAMGVTGAKFVTGSTVAMATAVADTLMDTAVMLGQEVSRATRGEENAGQQQDGKFIKVAKGTGVAALYVFDSLTTAGDRLLEEACAETSKTVAHRYGEEAGKVTHEGLGIAQDVKQVNDLVGKKAVKRLAAKGAMYTAKGMLNGQPVTSMSQGSLKSTLTKRPNAGTASSSSSPSRA